MCLIRVLTNVANLAELKKTIAQAPNVKVEKRRNRLMLFNNILTDAEIAQSDAVLALMNVKAPEDKAWNDVWEVRRQNEAPAPPVQNPLNAVFTAAMASTPAYEGTFITLNKIKSRLIAIYPDLCANGDIYILLKGGVAASLLLREGMEEKKQDTSSLFNLFQRGDNDIGIYINPKLSPAEFRSVFDVVNCIVQDAMLEDRPQYTPEGTFGKMILDCARTEEFPHGWELATDRDIYLEKKGEWGMEITQGGEPHGVRYSVNHQLEFVANHSFVSFTLHRLKMVFTVGGKIATGEILDIAIQTQRDNSLHTTFQLWKDNTVGVGSLK